MQPNEMLTAEPVWLTPADAEAFLSRNLSNRPKRNAKVTSYRDMMLNTLMILKETGHNPTTELPWRIGNPVFIIFDENEELQNGQHCLTALVEAEKARMVKPDTFGETPLQIAAVVVKGVQAADADLLDNVISRSHADVLFRKGLFDAELTDSARKKLSGILATAARIVYMRLGFNAKLRSSIPTPHSVMLSVIEQHPGLAESAAYIYSLDELVDETSGKAGGIRSLIKPAHAAAAHYLAWHSQLNADGEGMKRAMADKFFKVLATGKPQAGFDPGCPALALREWLMRQKGGKGNDAIEALYDAVVLAWLATKDAKNHPLRPGKPFTVLAKEWGDAKYVCMGGLDAAFTVVAADENAPAEEPLIPSRAQVDAALQQVPAEVPEPPAPEPPKAKGGRKPKAAPAEAAPAEAAAPTATVAPPKPKAPTKPTPPKPKVPPKPPTA